MNKLFIFPRPDRVIASRYGRWSHIVRQVRHPFFVLVLVSAANDCNVVSGQSVEGHQSNYGENIPPLKIYGTRKSATHQMPGNYPRLGVRARRPPSSACGGVSGVPGCIWLSLPQAAPAPGFLWPLFIPDISAGPVTYIRDECDDRLTLHSTNFLPLRKTHSDFAENLHITHTHCIILTRPLIHCYNIIMGNYQFLHPFTALPDPTLPPFFK